MHWFWRAVISVLVLPISAIVGVVCLEWVQRALSWAGTPLYVAGSAFILVSCFVVPPVVAVAAYDLLSRRIGSGHAVEQNTCPQCGHGFPMGTRRRCPRCGKRLWRVRAWLKWGSVGTFLVVASVWIASHRWSATTYGSGHFGIIANGEIMFGVSGPQQPLHFPELIGWHVRAIWKQIYLPGRPSLVLSLPYLSMLAVLPALILFWRDARRIPAGHCRHCRYDLTGNTSGTCPECGTAVSERAISSRQPAASDHGSGPGPTDR